MDENLRRYYMELKGYIKSTLAGAKRSSDRVLDTLNQQELAWRPACGCNSMGLILLHIARSEDMFTHNVIQDTSQIWVSEDWYKKLKMKEEETAQELASRGMDEFNDASYRVAIEVFEKLRNWYPFSKYAILAELKIADAYYNLGQYEEAIFAYEEFEKLHPRNEATPYVVNQIGLSYFGRVSTIDRDQKSTENASETFKRLIIQFPDSLYAVRAKENLRKCQESLANHELEIGLFYYKSKHYKAAIQRFKTVLTQYPDVGKIHQHALQFLALATASIEQQPKQ